jgi:hypothetical protein
MSTRAFQGSDFQFVPEAFQFVQTVAASGTFGINTSFTAAAKVTLTGAGALAIRAGQSAAASAVLKAATPAFAIKDGVAALAGLTFFNSTVVGIRLGQSNAAGAAVRNAAASLALKGAVGATAGEALRATAALGVRQGETAPAAVGVMAAADVLGLTSGVTPAHRAARKAVTAIATNLATAYLGRELIKATGAFGLSEGVLNRQQFINPHLSVNRNRLSFQHRIGHRGGGNRRRKPVRRVEPEKRPPTFADFLDNWTPPPFALPAPGLVRHSVRDTREAPRPRPLGADVLAIDRAIAEAFDQRDAFAMLEQLLSTEAAAREAADERDAAAVLSRIE